MKVTIKGNIYKDGYGDGYSFFQSDMSKHGYAKIGAHEIEYEIPVDWNPVAAEVEALNNELENMSEVYHRNVKAIKARISDLTCIEHSPEVTA